MCIVYDPKTTNSSIPHDSVAVFFEMIGPGATSAQGNSQCQACNCQFNNIDVLFNIVKSEIAKLTGIPCRSILDNIYALFFYFSTMDAS